MPAPPVIETARLRLRMFTPADAEAYYQGIFGDADVMRFLRGGWAITRADMPAVLERLVDAWRSRGDGFWAVEHAAAGRLLGHVGLKPLDTTAEIEIAYALAKADWGRGYATEAARAALRFGFEGVGLQRIVAVAVPENLASQRVMIKLGMVYDGMAHCYGADLVRYALDRGRLSRGGQVQEP